MLREAFRTRNESLSRHERLTALFHRRRECLASVGAKCQNRPTAAVGVVLPWGVQFNENNPRKRWWVIKSSQIAFASHQTKKKNYDVNWLFGPPGWWDCDGNGNEMRWDEMVWVGNKLQIRLFRLNPNQHNTKVAWGWSILELHLQ